MNFISDISQLEFYNPSPQFDCYGDRLFSPNDLMLQGQLPPNPVNAYTISIHAWSTDGLTDYGDVRADFDVLIGMNTDGVRYFNLRLNRWDSLFCSHGCFILHVVITDGTYTLFDGWTQKYIVGDCCVEASDITIVDSNGTNVETDCALPVTPIDSCGNPYMKFVTSFNCMDEFSGDFYGFPVHTYYSDASFAFERISWIQAAKRYIPLDLKRTVSLNCRLQKVERTRQWRIEGLTWFPLWKMQEIEDMLGSENIWLNGVLFSFAGGTSFSNILDSCRLPNDFRLNVILNECYEFQILGCSTQCAI